MGFAKWLIAFDYAMGHLREVSILGSVQATDTQALLDVCRVGYRPHQIIALGEPDNGSVAVPLLQGRSQIDGRATAYVCIDSTCHSPVADSELLRGLLES